MKDPPKQTPINRERVKATETEWVVPAASNTFERIKRVSPAGAEFWSARELARVRNIPSFATFCPSSKRPAKPV